MRILKRNLILASMLIVMLTGKCIAEVKMGYGWSINPDEKTAVKEALKMMSKQIKKPVLIMALNTAEYDTNSVRKYLDENTKDAKVFGLNSYKYVISPDGFHRGEKGAIGILGIESDDLIVGIATVATEDRYKVSEITLKAALKAIEDAGKTLNDKPLQILVAIADTPEEKAVEALTSLFGKDVPITGGTSADDKINKGVKFVYGNKEIFQQGISIAILYADEGIKAGNAFMSGYARTTRSGVVTRIRAFTGEHLRVIEEIDNRPAGEVYNEWIGGAIYDRMKNGESIFAEGHLHPLAMEMEFKGKKQYVTLCPGKIDTETTGLHVFAEPVVGQVIHCMNGTVDALIKRMKPMIKRAMVNGRIKKSEVAGAYVVYCRGAYGALGERYEELYPELKKAMGDKPFMAAFTSGEIGHIPGHGNFHGNLMTTTVVFGDKTPE